MKKTTFNCELAPICICVWSVCYVFTNKKGTVSSGCAVTAL